MGTRSLTTKGRRTKHPPNFRTRVAKGWATPDNLATQTKSQFDGHPLIDRLNENRRPIKRRAVKIISMKNLNPMNLNKNDRNEKKERIATPGQNSMATHQSNSLRKQASKCRNKIRWPPIPPSSPLSKRSLLQKIPISAAPIHGIKMTVDAHNHDSLETNPSGSPHSKAMIPSKFPFHRSSDLNLSPARLALGKEM